MTTQHLKIENLDTIQELSTKDFLAIQGGASVEETASITLSTDLPTNLPTEGRIAYPFPKGPIPLPYPIPCYGGHQPPTKPKPHGCFCSPYPTKGGVIPWCAVVL